MRVGIDLEDGVQREIIVFNVDIRLCDKTAVYNNAPDRPDAIKMN